MLRVAQVGLHVFYRLNPHAPPPADDADDRPVLASRALPAAPPLRLAAVVSLPAVPVAEPAKAPAAAAPPAPEPQPAAKAAEPPSPTTKVDLGAQSKATDTGTAS